MSEDAHGETPAAGRLAQSFLLIAPLLSLAMVLFVELEPGRP
jgi:hypothetical protein